MEKYFRLIAASCFFFFCTAASASSSWSPCSSHQQYQIKVEDVKVVPDPAVSGKDLEFQVSASTTNQITSGKLAISVYFYGIYIHREIDELCDKTSCPAGPGSFVLRSAQDLPGFTPSGPYSVKLEVLDDSSNNVLTCVNVWFRVKGSTPSSDDGVDERHVYELNHDT